MFRFSPLHAIDCLSQVIDFCWEQTKKNGYAGYPVAVWEKDQLTDYVTRTFHHTTDQILVAGDRTIDAVVCLMVDEIHNYLQTIGGVYSNQLGTALAKLESYRDEFYPGYMLLIGYPNKTEVRQVMEQFGNLIEELNFYRLDEMTEDLPGVVSQLSREEFFRLAQIHDRLNPGVYWTAERILDRWQIWQVYQLDGSAYSLVRQSQNTAEIYTLSFPDGFSREIAGRLLSGTTYEVFRHGVDQLISSCEPGGALDQIHRELGYQATGDYILFSI